MYTIGSSARAVAWHLASGLVDRPLASSGPPPAAEQRFRLSLTGNLDSWPYAPEDPTYLQEISLWVDASSSELVIWVLSLQPKTVLFFDLDSNKSTGYAYHGMPIGADLRVEVFSTTALVSTFDATYLRSTGAPTSSAAFPSTGDELPVDSDDLPSGSATLVLRIPLALLHGYIPPASPRAALPLALYAAAPAFDLVATLTFDTLPTPGYDVSSPMYISFGPGTTARLPASPPPPSPLQLGVPELQLFNDASYALVLLWEDADGNLALYDPLAEPLVVTLPRAHVRTEVTPLGPTLFRVFLSLPPVIPAGASLVVLRSDANYVLSPADRSPGSVAVILSSAIGEVNGERTIEHLDDDPLLAPITPYYYTAYIVTASGDYVASNYVARDRSIGSIVRGPIPGMSPDSDYLVFFSAWTEDNIRTAEKYDLVICHPGGGSALITAAQVRDIRDGPDNILGNADDTIVIGYISVGEDYGERGDGSGINNPRNTSLRAGLNTGTGPLTYDYTTGEAVYTNNGYPSFYVDMVGSYSDAGGSFIDFIPDGKPDQNTEWGGLYVNPGDPLWFTFLKEASYASVGTAGLDYILVELGMDGLFLDTLGVSAPWSFWQPPSTISDYYWLRHGGLDLIARLAYEYPDAVLIGNRPLHFAFPEFAGSRYDDFRSYLNGVYWESWAADMNFWWSEASGRVFNDQLVAAQDNADGRGFTTLVLDYWAVMFAARESGEAQGAPWYETPLEYLAAAEANAYPTHISPSRSLAEIDDVVYNIHHPDIYGGAPDVVIVSIIPEFQRTKAEAAWRPIPDATLVTVTLANRGAPPASPSDPYTGTLTIVHNDVELTQTGFSFSAGHYAPGSLDAIRVSVPLKTSGVVMGNHIYASVVLDAPEYDTTNNHDDVLLESFFYVVPAHIYKHDPPPDFVVDSLALDPPQPAANEPFDLLVTISNVGSGIGQASRAFIWSSFAQAQVGNFETPHLLPGVTTTVRTPHPPIPRAGKFSLAVTLDAVLAVPEADETNNEAFLLSFPISLSFAPLKTSEPSRESTASAASRASFDHAVLDSNAPDMIALSASIAASGEVLELAIATRSALPLSVADLIVFLNSDDDASTGYLAAGFDRMVLEGLMYRHDPAAGSGWGWIAVSGATDVDTVSIAYHDHAARSLYVYTTLVPKPAAGDGVSDAIPSSVSAGGRGLRIRLTDVDQPLQTAWAASQLAAESLDRSRGMYVAFDETSSSLALRLDSVTAAGAAINTSSDLVLLFAKPGGELSGGVFSGQAWRFVGRNGPGATQPSPPVVRPAVGVDADDETRAWAPVSSSDLQLRASALGGAAEAVLGPMVLDAFGFSERFNSEAPILVRGVLAASVGHQASASPHWLPEPRVELGMSSWAVVPNCDDGRAGRWRMASIAEAVAARHEAIDCGGPCKWACIPQVIGKTEWPLAYSTHAMASYDFERQAGQSADADVLKAILGASADAFVARLIPSGTSLDVLSSPGSYGTSVVVFFGSDMVDVGYRVHGVPGLSAHIMLMDSVGYVYDDANSANGTAWAWLPLDEGSETITRVVAVPGDSGVDFIVSRKAVTLWHTMTGSHARELRVVAQVTSGGVTKSLPGDGTYMALGLAPPPPLADVAVDGIGDEWASVAGVLTMADGSDDAVAPSGSTGHVIDKAHDFRALHVTSDSRFVYMLAEMQASGDASTDVDVALYVVPESGATRGYAVVDGVFAVAMVLNGEAYMLVL
ncbi:uncharacterized protein AMSG_01807 [Thecamonas trahens ATCC 50062]|uniref:CARDB domain-containing protein n=1 Tax=Thecamonas trahens ATCC 50062 TaxID=461836 RepID=A0A0L0DTF4_THETB|nr:hypothetical protein AMSG_01807 [Thecamonas trahens ATCC 50062]KNC55545.1 hypothetical protein AMSG_01807 [Thecamonas trahens ATCC 50062]|eukprot:XP_013761319.1 hypothetical protein AMSG_01807 [Thecamonas trahens ATCC 50062]